MTKFRGGSVEKSNFQSSLYLERGLFAEEGVDLSRIVEGEVEEGEVVARGEGDSV